MALATKDSAENFLKMYGRLQSSSTAKRTAVAELQQEIKDLKEENAKLKDLVVKGIPSCLSTTRPLLLFLNHFRLKILYYRILCTQAE